MLFLHIWRQLGYYYFRDSNILPPYEDRNPFVSQEQETGKVIFLVSCFKTQRVRDGDKLLVERVLLPAYQSTWGGFCSIDYL